jgi:hypothetical protein
MGEEKQNRVLQNFCGKPELLTIVASTKAVGKFVSPMAIFKGKQTHSEFTEGFANSSLVAVTDLGG